MERQREKQPGRRLPSPRQWREFERLVGQPIETEAGARFRQTETFRCLGIEPLNSRCNLAPLNEDFMKWQLFDNVTAEVP